MGHLYVIIISTIMCYIPGIKSFVTQSIHHFNYNSVCHLSSDSIDYESLSRFELQKLAKLNGIKANVRSSQIISSLKSTNATASGTLKKNSSKKSVVGKKVSTAKDNIVEISVPENVTDALQSSHIAQILQTQGISLSNLLNLRETLLDKSDADPRKTSSKRIQKDSSLSSSDGFRLPSNRMITTHSEEKQVESMPLRQIAREINSLEKTPAESKQSEIKSSDSLNNLSKNKIDSPAPIKKQPKDFNRQDVSQQHPSKTNENTIPNQSSSYSNKLDRKSDPSSNFISSKKSKKAIDLNGVTLKDMLEEVVSSLGFDGLHAFLPLDSFKKDPSITSSLILLRRTNMEWARKKLQYIYIDTMKRKGIENS